MIYQVEKWIKEKAFGCQTCGQCILTHTKFICPMNCPKGLRNGPCGGTLDGKCEVIPEIDCIWAHIETSKTDKAYKIHLPMDTRLLNTASYVNLINGMDRATRLPPRNQRAEPRREDNVARRFPRRRGQHHHQRRRRTNAAAFSRFTLVVAVGYLVK